MSLPRLLIVDDTAANIDLLRETLAPVNCLLSIATDGERALTLAHRSLPQLILLDVMMPGLDGFEVCRRLRRNPDFNHTSIIFVTARTEDVSAGFEAGGDDYITKPINASEVLARVRHHLEKAELLRALNELNDTLETKVQERTIALAETNKKLQDEIEERRYMQGRMQYFATHDSVTHLYNRTALVEKVSNLITDVQLYRRDVIFVLMDIEQFQLISESCGCIAGDALLKQFADLVNDACTSEMFFARIGGDNFALVCENSTPDEVEIFAQKVVTIVGAYKFSWENRIFEISTTVAIVPLSQEILAYDQVMLVADEMSYIAKREGANGIKRYQPSHTESPNARNYTINWALKLVDSLKHDLFELWFQKISALPSTSKAIESETSTERPQDKLEILLRLFDPETQKIIQPDSFIPASERLNLIPHIDRWVINQTAKYLSENVAQFKNVKNVSINLSAASMRDTQMTDYITFTLNTYNIPASKICFELTETEAIADISLAKRFLETLSRHGCSLALDDFGSGYASFNYLRDLPFDTVKIDGVFVRDMDKNPSYRALVKSITEIAHGFGKEVVAEYVENKTVLEAVKALNIEWAQGYHYHKPHRLNKDNMNEAFQTKHIQTSDHQLNAKK